jgi:hypothetical protein
MFWVADFVYTLSLKTCMPGSELCTVHYMPGSELCTVHYMSGSELCTVHYMSELCNAVATNLQRMLWCQT